LFSITYGELENAERYSQADDPHGILACGNLETVMS
jgi:hypothetical protein